jgi:hypothetical protein
MKFKLVFLFLFGSSMAMAQVGTKFPPMEAETLSNQMLDLPDALAGKYTIIGLAYTKKSEDDLTTWFSPAYNQFMRKPDKTNIFATDYDINLFFIPMFTGHKTVAYKSVMDKIKETVDQQLHKHVLFYKGSIKDYKEALNFKGRDEPYFFLLNDEGEIIWMTSGAYSTQKMQEVVDHLDEALGEW